MRVVRNPEAERRIQEGIEARISARFERRLRTALRRAAEDAARAYADSRSVDAVISSHDEVLQRAFAGMYTAAFETIGVRVARQIESAAKSHYPSERKQQMSDAMRTALDLFIRRWAARKVTQISRTTSEVIADDIRRGVEEGLSVTDIASRIAQHGRELAGYRANLIARTEVHSAANFGSLSAAQESGVVQMKEWIPVDDGRTRTLDNSDFDHVNVESVPVNQPFIVTGEPLMYPGDPSGSAGNIINCRCAMGYTV